MGMSNGESVSKHRREKRIKLRLLSGGMCCLCGYNRLFAALDFHHLDKTTKSFNIAGEGQTLSWDRLLHEVQKCILVCATCHREIEAGLHDETELVKHKISITEADVQSLIAKRGHLGTKSRPRKSVKRCIDCNIEVTKPGRCRHCWAKAQERIKWPSDEDLHQMVVESNYSAVGRALGVSDSAVRKRLKKSMVGAPFGRRTDC